MPTEDDKSVRRYRYGTLNTVNTNKESIHKLSNLDKLREIVSSYTTDKEEDIQVWSGVVLKVLSTSSNADYDPYHKNKIRTSDSHDIRQCIVRIPELDAAIPEPLTLNPETPDYDDMFVELHNVFTILDPTLPTPLPGDVVECDFRNRKNFSEGFITAIYSQPGNKTGGVLKSNKGGVSKSFDGKNNISTTPAITTPPEDWSGESRRWPEDKKLRSMDPVLAQKVDIILQNMRKRGFRPKVFYAWRSVQVQKSLKNKGSSNISFSYHNNEMKKNTPASMGADIVDSKILWGEGKPIEMIAPFWQALGEEVRKVGGLTWGGNWQPRGRRAKNERNRTLWEKYKVGWDPAHIELSGYSIKEVKRRNEEFDKS